MSKRPWMRVGFFVPMLAALLLVIAVSCGGAATSTTAAPAATTAAAATPVPVAQPTATPAQAASDAPYGNLRLANTQMGSYKGHPCTTASPTKACSGGTPTGITSA